MGFGSADLAPRIASASTAKYIDPRKSYWDHVVAISSKSASLYRRLRNLYSANWRMKNTAARMIYRGVFLPRVTYASEIWANGAKLEKNRKKHLSAQRAPLLAIKGAYKTSSTNCLAVVARTVPLDLEVRQQALRTLRATVKITEEELALKSNNLMTEWQTRYDTTEKEKWTKFMIPSVRDRLNLPLVLDHNIVQFLKGHGDFRGKLRGFKLSNDPICACDRKPETVRHVLWFCPRTRRARASLKDVFEEEGIPWPPGDGTFLSTKRTYETLTVFAKEALTNRTD